VRDLIDNRSPVDADAHRQEVLAMVDDLLRRHPEVGAIVSECANFPVHSAAIADAFGLPVYDIYTLVTWLHAGLRPRRFPPR